MKQEYKQKLMSAYKTIHDNIDPESKIGEPELDFIVVVAGRTGTLLCPVLLCSAAFPVLLS